MLEMKKVSILLSLLLLILLQQPLQAQLQPRTPVTPVSPVLDTMPQIQWVTLEEALAKSAENPKKIMLDFYTEWCRWCERMDKTTFRHPAIVSFINENFYPVKFDAEREDEILFNEKKYTQKRAGKRAYHELAIEMLRGRMSFPSVVFLDESTNVIQCLVGFKTPDQLMQLVKYFAEDHYKETPWTSYCRRFQAKGVFIDEV